jgi:hypothetical protein
MDYYCDGEAQALRCDTISFLMWMKGELDNAFVDLLNNGDARAGEVLVEIKRLDKRIQTELKTLCI